MPSETINSNAVIFSDPSIYAHWELNETSGDVAKDSSGHGRKGTTVNMENVDWVAGKLNNCLQFDGVDGYVNCGNVAAFERTDKFSYEFWMNTSSLTNYITIMSKTPYGAWRGMEMFVVSGKIRFYLIASGGQIDIASTAIVNTGVWKHVVLTYNGNNSNTGVKVYVNGVEGHTGTGTLINSIVNSNNFQISGRAGAYNCFNGKLDEVVIYDYVLSSGQVLQRYNAGSGRENFPFNIKSDAYISLAVTKTVTINSDAYINKANEETITSDAQIIKLNTITSDAYIKVISNEETISSDAWITGIAHITSDMQIGWS